MKAIGQARKAIGQARHRFWGEYSAVIALKFDSEEELKNALPQLKVEVVGDYLHASGHRELCQGFSQVKEQTNSCVAFTAGVMLDRIVDKLVEFGADRRKILSMAKSINYGERFEINVPWKDDSPELELKENNNGPQ